MTLNQTIKLIETIALSHRQINHFFIGAIEDFVNRDVQYPAIFCEIKPGVISKALRVRTYNFTFYFLDLLNISSEAMANQWEVKSDMDSVAQDFLAMLADPDYDRDWEVVTSSAVEFHDFKLHDLCSGISANVGISVRYDSNRCQVPGTAVVFDPTTTSMIVQNFIYFGLGTEGSSITFATLANKKILWVFKGDKLLVARTQAEITGGYVMTSNDFVFTVATGGFLFGNEIELDQVIQILWRNI